MNKGTKAKFIFSAAASLLSASVAAPTVTYAQVRGNHTEEVAFHVFSQNHHSIAGARIACIGPDGKVLQSGLTNKSGNWTAKLPLQQDPMFKEVEKMGMVTALAVAKGYNEAVVFKVPVMNQEQQPIAMEKLKPNQQNGPTYSIGNIHRLTIMQMVQRYAKQLKLKRQSPLTGEEDYAPYGPEIGK